MRVRITRRLAAWLPVTVATLSLACASAPIRNDASAPRVELTQQHSGVETLYLRGPVPLTFELTIHNPLAVPVTLERLELRTQGSGAFTLRAEGFNLDRTIPPGGEETVRLHTWGHSRGGFLGSSEPVTLVGTAIFDSPAGAMSRIFTEYLPQRG